MILLYHGTPTLYPVISSDLEPSVPQSHSHLSRPQAQASQLVQPSGSQIEQGHQHEKEVENILPARMLAIRFAQPVVVSSILIVPLGVECPSGAGQTSPDTFMADIYFNIVGAKPPNALAHTKLSITSRSDHALNFPLNMNPTNPSPSSSSSKSVAAPTSTRLMIIQARVEKLTLSVYGYHLDQSLDFTTNDEKAEPMVGVTSKATVGDNAKSISKAEISTLSTLVSIPPTKDLLSAFKGSSDSLINRQIILALGMAAQTSLDLPTLLSLDITPLSQLSNTDLGELFTQILGVSVNSTSYHPQALLAALLLLHNGSANKKDNINPTSPSLSTLLQAPIPIRSTSHLFTLLELCDALSASTHPLVSNNLGYIVSRLSACRTVGNEQTSPQIRNAIVTLARLLPPLAALAITMRSTNETNTNVNPKIHLDLDKSHSKEIVNALFMSSTRIVNGKSTFEASRYLAQEYLGHLDASDPIRRAFESHSHEISPTSTSDTFDQFTSNPLTRALSQTYSYCHSQSQLQLPILKPYSSSLLLSVQPADLIATIAPSLFLSLATAQHPPFGIQPIALGGPKAGAQASDWGGKVYSRDEFRRDREAGVGLSTAGTGSVVGGVNVSGLGMNGASLGPGVSIGNPGLVDGSSGSNLIGMGLGVVGLGGTNSMASTTKVGGTHHQHYHHQVAPPGSSQTMLDPHGPSVQGLGGHGNIGIGFVPLPLPTAQSNTLSPAQGQIPLGFQQSQSPMGGSGGLGSGGSIGRKASRHVDEF